MNVSSDGTSEIFLEKAYNKALKSLSYRPRSEKEISDFLAKKKFDSSIISKAIEKLKEQNLINDEEFVKWWIEQRQTHKPKSTFVLKQELIAKGVAKELIEELLTTSQNDEESARLVFEKSKIKFKNYKGEEFLKKTIAFLQRRGFSWEIIKKIIDDEK